MDIEEARIELNDILADKNHFFVNYPRLLTVCRFLRIKFPKHYNMITEGMNQIDALEEKRREKRSKVEITMKDTLRLSLLYDTDKEKWLRETERWENWVREEKEILHVMNKAGYELCRLLKELIDGRNVPLVWIQQ